MVLLLLWHSQEFSKMFFFLPNRDHINAKLVICKVFNLIFILMYDVFLNILTMPEDYLFFNFIVVDWHGLYLMINKVMIIMWEITSLFCMQILNCFFRFLKCEVFFCKKCDIQRFNSLSVWISNQAAKILIT